MREAISGRFGVARRAALLLAAMVWTASIQAAGGLVVQHTEDLQPSLVRPSNGDSAILVFSAFGREFRLLLSDNQRLTRLAAGSGVQLYEGTLDGAPHSWARVTVVDGLPRGMIWDGSELFIVDAATDAVNYGAAGTVMFKLSDAQLEQGVSLMDDAVTPRDPAAAYDALVGELRARAQAVQAAAPTRGVEISILGDADYLARYSSESQARDAILTRLNSVDGIFSSQVGVELQVASIDLSGELTRGLSTTTDPGTLLEELSKVRLGSAELVDTGLTHLFTGRQLNGQTSGIAYTHALCSRRFGASMTVAHNSAAVDALITAHEIGHVFGAPHDGTERCASTPQGQYIMTPTFTGTSISSFSQCSLDEINAVIDSYACLEKLPEPAPGPAPPAPPAPSPDNPGDGNGHGGGTLDASVVLLLLALCFRRRRREF